MNDPNSPEPIDDVLEELEPEAPAAPAPAAPPPAGAPAMAPMAMGPQPAHKQLYQFLWGGLAVLFGCLLPFNDYAPDWKADRYRHVSDALVDEGVSMKSLEGVEKDGIWMIRPAEDVWGSDQTASPGPMGIMTFAGAIVAFCALLFVGAQWYCMRFRKVMLGPIALMLFICAWAWMRFGKGGPPDLGFQAGLDAAGEPFTPTSEEWLGQFKNYCLEGQGSFVKFFYDGTYISDYFTHLGPGYFFILAGSTYVMVTFVLTVVGVGAPKKKAPAEAAAPGKGGKGGRGGKRR